jgi:hypothetical protein
MIKPSLRSTVLFALLSAGAAACLAAAPASSPELWPAQGRTAAPAGCAEAWLEHKLAGAPRVIKAIRLGFVLDKMPMAVGRAGLLIAQ